MITVLGLSLRKDITQNTSVKAKVTNSGDSGSRISLGLWAECSVTFGLSLCSVWFSFVDLLMGLFRGAVFRRGRGARKQPIKQPSEMPTSTMALMGRFRAR